ncbi:MAG TPA: PIN domain-containing protein [Candidatus Limnocylindrales bacterium]|nr:PIN domain-containing protein [Candidatus Limnocylindrales bacterium]
MKVFVDTSALLAILDEDDRHHPEAAAVFRSLLTGGVELVTSNYVEVESAALVRRRLGAPAALELADGILPTIKTIWVDEPLHRAALAAHRASASVSLVDQVSFEVMRRQGIVTAFAFDSDFDAQGFHRAVAASEGQGRRLSELRPPYSTADDQPSDLVSVAEIAFRAGRSVNTVQSWRRRRPDFPAPVASLATGPVWTWPVVEHWISNRPAPGRGARIVSALRTSKSDVTMSTDEIMALTRGE